MGETRIPYCDATWDLTIGCRRRSPGCEHCWATRTVHRLAAKGVRGYCADEEESEDGDPCLRQTTLDGRNWEPQQRVNLLAWNLNKPFHWHKPRFVFVNSKSDLFDERVRLDFIAQAMLWMATARQHRYMVLTKEPGRMARFIQSYTRIRVPQWPRDFPPVILMTSIEDAYHLDRWEQLRQIPAALRGVSFEPLLAPLAEKLPSLFAAGQVRPDWVVIGCEKELGGRAGRWDGISPASWWAEAGAIVRICREAGIRVWMKQGPTLLRRVTDKLEQFPENCQVQERPAWPAQQEPLALKKAGLG